MTDEKLTARIRERYLAIKAQIATAAESVGRAPESVQLVVVTKAQSAEVTQAAINGGAQVLGENYPEQAVMKMQAMSKKNKVEWHMIGHVQSRKANLVAENFALLHSLDSLKLAKRLDRLAAEASRTLPVLLEINIGGEISKFGWNVPAEADLAAVLPEIEEILSLPNLEVRGLMTMPPFFKDAELARPYFQQLRQIRDHLSVQFPQVNWEQLSMGTSGDFPVAVQEGATYVRVGQAIVGKRSV